MNDQSKSVLLNVSIAVFAGMAVIFAVSKARGFHREGEAGAKVWFYDQHAKRLYAAPRDLISPDGDTDARVRAVVVGFEGIKNDPGQLRIAYLEKYSPDFKALLDRAQAAHRAKLPFTERIPAAGSPYAQENTFIRRPGETAWHAIESEEALQIMAEWRAWRGPAGQAPIISVPAVQ